MRWRSDPAATTPWACRVPSGDNPCACGARTAARPGHADRGPVDAGAGHWRQLRWLKHHLRTHVECAHRSSADRLFDLGGNPTRMVMDLVAAVLQARDAFQPVAPPAMCAHSAGSPRTVQRARSPEHQHRPPARPGVSPQFDDCATPCRWISTSCWYVPSMILDSVRPPPMSMKY